MRARARAHVYVYAAILWIKNVQIIAKISKYVQKS